jgi:hypothetical protein
VGEGVLKPEVTLHVDKLVAYAFKVAGHLALHTPTSSCRDSLALSQAQRR